MKSIKHIKAFGLTLAIALAAPFALESNLKAQDLEHEDHVNTSPHFRWAVGVRGGEHSGLTVKYRPSASHAYEGILSISDHRLRLTGLYEHYAQAFGVSGMHWYYGGGGHVELWSDDLYWPDGPGPDRDLIGLGVDGIVGLEYKIPPIPFAVSLDVKPHLSAYTNGAIGWGIDPGLGIKFAF